MSGVLSFRDTGEKNTVSFSSTRCQERLWLKSRSEVAAATLELIKKEQRRTQASLVYLRNDGAKDYKTESTARLSTPRGNQSWGYRNILPSIKWTGRDSQRHHHGQGLLHAAHYAVPIYNNLPHSALDNHKSPNDVYGDSCNFSKLYVFGSICYALQPSKLLHKLEEKSTKTLFLVIDPAGYQVLDLQSKVAYVSRTVKVFDGKFLSTKENQIPGLCREEEPENSSSLDTTPARLEDSHDSPQGPRERRSTADLTHARILQL